MAESREQQREEHREPAAERAPGAPRPVRQRSLRHSRSHLPQESKNSYATQKQNFIIEVLLLLHII